MEASLRSFGLSVPQYSCLEILDARPGISNADLARGVFVTRQAMHQLLGGLQEAELVSAGGQGRVQRYSFDPRRTTNHRGRISGGRSGGGTDAVWLAAIRATAAA